MPQPPSCGSSSSVSIWPRATVSAAWTGCTRPSSSPSPCVAWSASLLPWQPTDHLAREEPDTEGQSLSSHFTAVFPKRVDLIRGSPSMCGVYSPCLDPQTLPHSLCVQLDGWRMTLVIYSPFLYSLNFCPLPPSARDYQSCPVVDPTLWIMSVTDT